MTVVDTAEMYGDGAAEELVGEAIAGCRDEVFLGSKVLPGNATRRGTIEACERSLHRLRTDRLDLYLLHWRGIHRLEGTIEGSQSLLQAGKIRDWGVSNFDVSDMDELVGLPGGSGCATDQVLYNLTRRGIEHDLLPWCHRRRMPIMAYSPIEQGRMLSHHGLQKVAERHGATSAQVALAWVLRNDGIIAIPRAGEPNHVRENHRAVDLHLTEKDLAELDQAFSHGWAAYGFADIGPYSGGQAEFLRVPYGDYNCLILPEDAEEKELDYVMLSDIFPTGWHSTRLANLTPGDSVVIYGSGPVGLMAALSARVQATRGIKEVFGLVLGGPMVQGSARDGSPSVNSR